MGNVCIDKMAAADGILLGSPTYVTTSRRRSNAHRPRLPGRQANGGMFPQGGRRRGAVRRAGAIHAFDSLNHFFLINEMIIPSSSYWNIGIGREPAMSKGTRRASKP